VQPYPCREINFVVPLDDFMRFGVKPHFAVSESPTTRPKPLCDSLCAISDCPKQPVALSGRGQ